MLISDTFEFEDTVSGLKLKVIPRGGRNVLHIEQIGEPESLDRDFLFTASGEFDGVGRCVAPAFSENRYAGIG